MKKIIATIMSLIIMMSPITAFASEYLYGYDISTHNEVIDIASAKENNKSFLMIRLGYSDKYVDTKFLSNVKNAYEGNMPFGVYLYSYAFNEAEAKSEARFVIKTLEAISDYGDMFRLPVAYDLEENEILQNADRDEISKIMTAFCEEIKAAGYVPMVYANKYWYENYIDITAVSENGYKTWYAYYPSEEPDFSKPVQIGTTGLYADIWQYKKGDAKLNTLDENIMFTPDKTVKPAGCVHKLNQSIKPATVTANGAVIYTCERCGEVAKKDIIPKIKSVSLKTSDCVYNGKARRPEIIVKDNKGKAVTKENYTVSYSANTDVGYASAKITFNGKYSGTKNLKFRIIPKGTSISKLTPKKTSVKVEFKKQVKQISGYEIQYSKNKGFKKGNKTITVKGTKKNSATIKKLKTKNKYYVRIRTYKIVSGKKLCSAWSKAKSVTLK